MKRWSREVRASAWSQVSAALLIAGAQSQAGAAARIALDHGGGSVCRRGHQDRRQSPARSPRVPLQLGHHEVAQLRRGRRLRCALHRHPPRGERLLPGARARPDMASAAREGVGGRDLGPDHHDERTGLGGRSTGAVLDALHVTSGVSARLMPGYNCPSPSRIARRGGAEGSPLYAQHPKSTTKSPLKVSGTRLAVSGARRHPVAHTGK